LHDSLKPLSYVSRTILDVQEGFDVVSFSQFRSVLFQLLWPYSYFKCCVKSFLCKPLEFFAYVAIIFFQKKSHELYVEKKSDLMIHFE